MNDIFGKIVSFFLAAVILFGLPLVYMNERAKTAKQMFLLTEATGFVDSVCNTGRIDQSMLQQFYDTVGGGNDYIEIGISHVTREYVYNDDLERYELCERWFDEEDIFETVMGGREYLFMRGDFLRVKLQRKGGFSIPGGPSDNTVKISYGGTVKYEAF